jgi:hypothetical protein
MVQDTLMPNLYSYCIPVDDGAAPNPFWGTCTLAICKPSIRRKAKEGDWIVGTGSKRSLGDISGKVVYAMKVSRVLSLEDYDRWTKRTLPKKIPSLKSRDWRRKLGDSIYDYSGLRPKQRAGVHDKDNMNTDLRGKNVLVSKHFFYFGDNAKLLPFSLRAIAQQIQGHRVHKNKPYVEPFLEWLESLKLVPNRLYGKPATKPSSDSCKTRSHCAKQDLSRVSKRC